MFCINGLFVLLYLSLVQSSQLLKDGKSERLSLFLNSGTPKAVSQKETCIAAVVYARIYANDKPELTALELEQWLHYVVYAGVKQVYFYDTYIYKNESLQRWATRIMTRTRLPLHYHDWHEHTPFTLDITQHSAYRHAIEHYGDQCMWHMALDMDEYPFVLNDTDAGFLKRLVDRYNIESPECSELSIQNYIFSGAPNRDKLWLPERLLRRLPDRANRLDKPIYRIRDVASPRVHHNLLARGRSCDIPSNQARFNHYWGARLQNWQPDTPQTLAKTIEDRSVLPIVQKLKVNAKLYTLGWTDVLSVTNSWFYTQKN